MNTSATLAHMRVLLGAALWQSANATSANGKGYDSSPIARKQWRERAARIAHAIAGLERRQHRAAMVAEHGMHSDDRRVRGWTRNSRGLVKIGKRLALGGYGSHCIVSKDVMYLPCSACCAVRKDGSGLYQAPAVLWGRWEPALGRPMYYFRPAHRCPRCHL